MIKETMVLEELEEGFEKVWIPPYMRQSLIEYVVSHRKPGHFLTAVLMNDLTGAVSQADSNNRQVLPSWIMLLCNHVPRNCWGSPEKVNDWVKND